MVETGTAGPARCAQCRAYVNPWCKWVSGGLKWECNLCKHETEGLLSASYLSFPPLTDIKKVATEYFSNLDANLLRLDHLQRPELNKGTVDFDVSTSEEYWAFHPPPQISPSFYSPQPMPSGSRPPTAIDYFFAFDVSGEAIVSEFLHASCEALKRVLFGSADANGLQYTTIFPDRGRVAILTFDTTLHFYDLSVCQFCFLKMCS